MNPKLCLDFVTSPQVILHITLITLLLPSRKKCLMFSHAKKMFIIGDLNVRFGASVRDLLINRVEAPKCRMYSYPTIPDDVRNPNDNAYMLSTLCMNSNLLVINNLKTTNHLFRGKTYRKKDSWISEVDVFLGSCDALRNISSINVHQTIHLPSDHAPISFRITVT